MARKTRRQRRLTLPPKQKSALSKVAAKQNTVDSIQDDPFYSQWVGLEPVGHFRLRHQTFRKNDSAQVYYQADPDDDSDASGNEWIAHIVGIRHEPGKKDSTWVHVRWYYSQQDLREEFPSLAECDFMLAPRERVYSTRAAFLSSNCFKKLVNVVQWHEKEPFKLKQDTFFIRFQFDWYATGFNVEPAWLIKPRSTTCVEECCALYSPFLDPNLFSLSTSTLRTWYRNRTRAESSEPPNPIALQTDTMHYCSRPSCRRWYHRACLTHIGASGIEDPDTFLPGSRPLRRIAVDPQLETQDVNEQLQALTFPRNHSASALRSITSSGDDSAADVEMALTDSSVYDTLQRVCTRDLGLPESLVRVASMPIMRRACVTIPKDSQFPPDPDYDASQQRARIEAYHPHYSIASGNMSDVLLAQNIMHQEIEHPELHEYVDELWKYYQEEWLDDMEAKEYGMDLFRNNRIVASPREEYWDRIEGVYDQLFGDEEVPPFRCPSCAAPI